MGVTNPVNSRDLQEPNRDDASPTSSEVQFALVIARMIETVKSDPELMRRAVYDLARHKLQEQLGNSSPAEMKQAELALEAAIRGVEQFSREQIGLPPPSPVPQLAPPSVPARSLREIHPLPSGTNLEFGSVAEWRRNPFWTVARRGAFVLLVTGAATTAVHQRERLASLGKVVQNYGKQVAPEQALAPVTGGASLPSKHSTPEPNRLRPTDYGVYAVGDNSLTELQLLPGRPPDIRIAVSAAFKLPGKAILPTGHPKFIVFRRDVATNILERAEVRVIARIAREFSTEAAGKRLGDDDVWVIRNFAYPFRISPAPDNSEMYELHSEDPGVELPPGNYALVLKNQAYYFSIDGDVIDPRQCIERVVATNGTFYAACRKP